MDFATPEAYAAHLATYIASPLKIEKLVLLDFGRAPPLHIIAECRYRVEQQARKPLYSFATIKDGPANDGEDWRPRTFVPQAKPAPRTAPRIKDYIIIERPELANPFAARVRVGDKLIASVGRDFDLSPDLICSTTRSQPLVHARAVIIMLLKLRGWSYPQIGKLLSRDHSSIIHATQQFDIYCKVNPLVRESYNRHLSLIAEAEAPQVADAA